MQRSELDGLLRRLAKNGSDAVAWSSLYRLLWPRGYAAAYRTLRGNPARAEDVCQEAFLRLLRLTDFKKINNEEDFLKYFFTVIRHCAIDRLATEVDAVPAEAVASCAALRDQPEEDIDSYDHTDVPGGDVSQLRRLLSKETYDRFLRELTPRERQLFILVGLGYTLDEVAARLGASYASAAVQVHRLRKKLNLIRDR